MKNIHIIPTEKPSRLLLDKEENRLLPLQDEPVFMEHQNLVKNQNIYITSDTIPKLDEWGINLANNVLFKDKGFTPDEYSKKNCKKIILTTDQDLINDGVQAIDDEFLEWFVKNPSCERVEIRKFEDGDCEIVGREYINYSYEIIIPKEEPKTRVFGTKDDKQFWSDKPIQKGHPDYKETLEHKQETLEEAAEHIVLNNSDMRANYSMGEFGEEMFKRGAKWQAERMYSEEEMKEMIDSFEKLCYKYQSNKDWFPIKKDTWFKQFKKK